MALISADLFERHPAVCRRLPLTHEYLAPLLIGKAEGLKEHGDGIGKSVPKSQSYGEFAGLRKIQFACQGYVSVPGFVEFEGHFVVLCQIGIPVACSDIPAREA